MRMIGEEKLIFIPFTSLTPEAVMATFVNMEDAPRKMNTPWTFPVPVAVIVISDILDEPPLLNTPKV